MSSHDLTRREFIAATATAAVVAGSASADLQNIQVGSGPRPRSSMPPPRVCVFSKHLPFVKCEDLGSVCKDLGLDGVDLTVRAGGHVPLDNVVTDLPKAVEAIRKAGIEVPMITTTLNDGYDPNARPILETASKLGIPFFRAGGHTYEKTVNPAVLLPKIIGDLRRLAALAQELNIVAGYHNHSGYDNFGAAIWDLYEAIKEVNSPALGSNFDIGHAKVEGGYGAWQINARLMAPYVKMMAVKDFVWEKDKPRWVPLGQGIVPTAEFLKIFRDERNLMFGDEHNVSRGFSGPISLHFEYKVKSNDQMLKEIAQAAETLRGELKKAGYA